MNSYENQRNYSETQGIHIEIEGTHMKIMKTIMNSNENNKNHTKIKEFTLKTQNSIENQSTY